MRVYGAAGGGASGIGLVRDRKSPAQAAASPRTRLPRWRGVGGIRSHRWGGGDSVGLFWRHPTGAAGLGTSMIAALATAIAPPGRSPTSRCAIAPSRSAATNGLAEVLDLLCSEPRPGLFLRWEHTGRISGDPEHVVQVLGRGVGLHRLVE